MRDGLAVVLIQTRRRFYRALPHPHAFTGGALQMPRRITGGARIAAHRAVGLHALAGSVAGRARITSDSAFGFHALARRPRLGAGARVYARADASLADMRFVL